VQLFADISLLHFALVLKILHNQLLYTQMYSQTNIGSKVW